MILNIIPINKKMPEKELYTLTDWPAKIPSE